MQANIWIKDKKLSEDIQKFKDKNYRHMSLTKLFVHALVELMKREEK
ncbi:MAG: hypothetical protein GY793_02030 [Proteobacteria bacterium]|nr:hypothetical protein [Pseudomonadota bacterium]